MQANILEQKIHLRAYTVAEIEALREAVTSHEHIGLYKPTLEQERRGRKIVAPDSILVEEKVRTLMLAGLTADDLNDTPKSVEKAERSLSLSEEFRANEERMREEGMSILRGDHDEVYSRRSRREVFPRLRGILGI